jgi:DNA modification methylase
MNMDKKNKLNDLSSKEWVQETKSYFFQKGLGNGNPATKYEKMHPAPFSFTDIMRLIRFFTKKDEKVLDPFVGIGSTIKACIETKRDGYGVELSSSWYKLTKKRIFEESKIRIDKEHLICEDSRNLIELFEEEYFDFIVTSPPYWNILEKKDHKANGRVKNGQATKYSENKKDLGNIDNYEQFLDTLSNIFLDCYTLLKSKKYMCIIVSDFRHKSRFYPFHSDLLAKLTNENSKGKFHLKGIKILIQNAKKLFPYGYPFAYVENIHHQYVIILQK